MKVLKTSISVLIVFTTISCSENRLEELSCENPLTTASYMEFTASTGSETRTQLTNENKVEWLAGDEISIFDGEANRRFTTKENGKSVVFGGKANKASIYYALYPYQEGVTIEGNVIKNVTLPSIQVAKAGSFEDKTNISVASATSDLQLAFKNIGSLVKFSMSNNKATDVRSVKLTGNRGEVIAGTLNITVYNNPTATVINPQSQVTLTAEDGFEKDKDYYFAVLPGLLDEGFSLTFTDNEGKTWQKTYTASATLNRSGILKLNDIELGTFTNSLLVNTNLIAAAEACSGQTFTKNADGTVSLLNSLNKQIADAVINLDLSGKNDPTICDEIGVFTNLEVLDCRSNGITSLDMSSNLRLKELNCEGVMTKRYYDNGAQKSIHYDGMLTSLDVSKNTELIKLRCGNNRITSLDLSGNPKLQELYCEGTYNIVKGDPDIYSFEDDESYYERETIEWYGLSSLNITKNSELIILNCNYHNIGTLDMSGSPKLKELQCFGASGVDEEYGLNSLTVSGNSELVVLYCSGNNLKNLDVSGNSELVVLYCNGNNLKNLDISNCNKLEDLACASNEISILNVTNNHSLKQLRCGFNPIESLDLSKNTSLTYLDCNYNEFTSLDVSQCLHLDTLYCSHSQFTSLDLSGLTELKYVLSQFSQLETLNVTGCTSLTDIWTVDNKLQTLDLSTCVNLVALSCGLNQLTSINVSNCRKLKEFYVRDNNLTTLDISHNEALTNFTCQRNHLTSLDVSNNSELLLYNINVGNQSDYEGNDQTLNLYVNATQITQPLNSANVNILLKTDTTQEGNGDFIINEEANDFSSSETTNVNMNQN